MPGANKGRRKSHVAAQLAWRVLALPLATYAFAGLAAAAPNPLSQCAVAARYLPTTCACLKRVMPQSHLTGEMVAGTCPFDIPPPWFNPSRASPETLKSWGIPDRDAAELGDPKVRMAYFQGVMRAFMGEGCGGGVCGPSLGTTWRPPDGRGCHLPSVLSYYCIEHGAMPKPVLSNRREP